MQQTNKIRLKGTIIHMEVSRKRIMYTIATNVGINHAQPDVALIVKDNVKKEDIKFVPGDRVKISAHVQYSKQENNEETEYLKTLVIDEMETADSTEQDVFDLDEVGQEDLVYVKIHMLICKCNLISHFWCGVFMIVTEYDNFFIGCQTFS